MVGQFTKAYLHRPIKIIHFLTPAIIQKCLTYLLNILAFTKGYNKGFSYMLFLLYYSSMQASSLSSILEERIKCSLDSRYSCSSSFTPSFPLLQLLLYFLETETSFCQHRLQSRLLLLSALDHIVVPRGMKGSFQIRYQLAV